MSDLVTQSVVEQPAGGEHAEPAFLGLNAGGWVAVAMLAVFALLATARQRSLAAGGLPVTLCAGVATEPTFAVGVAWASPLSSAIPPLMLSPRKGCLTVPGAWVSPFTDRHAGQWSVP